MLPLSNQQRKLLLYLASAPSFSWRRSSVRTHLYGFRVSLSASQRASFSRMLVRLEHRGLIRVGGSNDGAYITLTVRGQGAISAGVVNNG